MNISIRSVEGARRPVAVMLVVALTFAVLAVSGCTSPSAKSTMMPNSSTPAVSTASDTTSSSASATSGVQTCGVCGKKGMGPKVVGEPVTSGSAQVVNVGFVNGYYSPNTFTVKAGSPIQVVFTGKAKGCLAKPMFKSLNKKADVTSTGSATIDLGTLKPGVYKFTCAMGMNTGTITVQ